MAGFLFGGNTGVASPDELQRRRAIVDALVADSLSGVPNTFGEGIATFGKALAGRFKDKKLTGEEDAERARVGGKYDAIVGGLMGPSSGGGGGGVSGGGGSSRANYDPLDPRNIAGDTMAALGKDSGTAGYRASLIGTESGGNWGARNNEMGAGGQAGHFGRVQFGKARLQEAMDAGAIPQGTTPEQFMQSPALQIAAENWHFGDLESKLGDLVGREVNGQVMDLGALVAMGHLGGAGGARKYVESGGRYNPADSFGTSLAEYAQTHGGQMGAQPDGGQITMSAAGGADPMAATPAQAGPDLAKASQLAELLSNPYLDAGKRKIAELLLAEAMTPPDPMADIELQMKQLELQQMQNPQAQIPPEVQERMMLAEQGGLQPGTPEYQQYVLNGKTGADAAALPAGFQTLDLQARAAGYEPGTPEYQQFMANGGGSGTPAAFTALDMQANAAGFADGTPEYEQFMATRGAGLAAQAATEGKAMGEMAVAAPAQVAQADRTLEYIDAARNHPGLDWGTGGSSWTGAIPGTDAYDFQNRIRQLSGGAFLTAIDDLRGMGALSNAEGSAATAAIGRLDVAASKEEFLAALADYEKIVKMGRDRAAGKIAPPAAEQPQAQDSGLSEDDLKYLEMP